MSKQLASGRLNDPHANTTAKVCVRWVVENTKDLTTCVRVDQYYPF